LRPAVRQVVSKLDEDDDIAAFQDIYQLLQDWTRARGVGKQLRAVVQASSHAPNMSR